MDNSEFRVLIDHYFFRRRKPTLKQRIHLIITVILLVKNDFLNFVVVAQSRVAHNVLDITIEVTTIEKINDMYFCMIRNMDAARAHN